MIKRNQILKEIKYEYMNKKKFLPRETIETTEAGINVIMVAIITSFFEIMSVLFDNKGIFLTAGIMFLLLFIHLLLWNKIEKKHKNYRDKKEEQINIRLTEAIKRVASKYQINEKELAIYLLLTYKSPIIIQLFCRGLSLIATVFSVYYITLNDINIPKNIANFILLIANLILSFTVDIVNNKLSYDYNFDFYVKRPYNDLVYKIDNLTIR